MMDEVDQRLVAELRRDGRVMAYESQMRGRDGKPVDVRLWAVLIDIEGEECILSSTVNVSEEMVGHKFGEFAPTRNFPGHAADKKAKRK